MYVGICTVSWSENIIMYCICPTHSLHHWNPFCAICRCSLHYCRRVGERRKCPGFPIWKERGRASHPGPLFQPTTAAEITYVCLLIIILQGSGILFIHQCFSKSLQICMYCTVHTYNSWFNCLSCLSFIITRFHSVPQERAVLIQHHTKPHRYIAARTYYLSIIAPVCHRW